MRCRCVGVGDALVSTEAGTPGLVGRFFPGRVFSTRIENKFDNAAGLWYHDDMDSKEHTISARAHDSAPGVHHGRTFLSVYYDGACGPINPGGVASWGFVLKDQSGLTIYEGAGYVGEGPSMSNNVAEYEAIVGAMKYLVENGYTSQEIRFFGDSRLTVEQMSGRWKIKKGLYLASVKRACILGAKFKKISFTWIPREQNEEADELSKQFAAPLSRSGAW